MRIHYSREPWPALETGGGIFGAAAAGHGPFLLVNGDVYTDMDFARCASRRMLWRSWCWCPIPRTTRAAISALDAQGRIGTEGGERLTYSGIALLPPGAVRGLRAGRFPLLPLLQRARRAAWAGRARGALARRRHAGAPARTRRATCQRATMTPDMSGMLKGLKDIPSWPSRRAFRTAARSGEKYPTPQGFTAIRDGQKPRGDDAAARA